MDSSQWFLVKTIALTSTPFYVALIAVAFAWRSISHRALFALIAIVSMFGMAEMLYPLVSATLDTSRSGPSAYPGGLFTVLAATEALVVLFGFPMLWWLRNALRRT